MITLEYINNFVEQVASVIDKGRKMQEEASQYFPKEGEKYIMSVHINEEDFHALTSIAALYTQLGNLEDSMPNMVKRLYSLYSINGNCKKVVEKLKSILIQCFKLQKEIVEITPRIKEISKNLPKSNVNILDEFLFVINKKVECLKNVNNAFLCNDKDVQKEISKKFIEQFLILKEAVISCEKKIPSSIEKLLGIKEYIKKMDPVVRVYQKSLGIKGIEKFDPFASICKIEGYNGKEEALYEEGGGGGKGKPLAEPTISPASAEAGAAAGKALELSVESLSTIEKLVEFAFSCEYKKPTYIIQRRVLRWDTHSLTPTKIYENNEIFGDFAKQDENYLKNQILYHSGTGLDKILNCPELRKIFCKPEESAFILECILTLKAEGENPPREIPGSFLCRYNENNQIYHRHFKEKIWGGNYDHLVEIYLGRDRTDTKEYEPGSEDGEVEGMGNVMARALENGNIYIGLKDHSLIEGYVILRNE